MGEILMQKARLAEMIAQRGRKRLLEVGGAWGSTRRPGGRSHGEVGGAPVPRSLSKGDRGSKSLEPCQSVSSAKCDETWTQPALENNLTYTGACKWMTDRAERSRESATEESFFIHLSLLLSSRVKFTVKAEEHELSVTWQEGVICCKEGRS